MCGTCEAEAENLESGTVHPPPIDSAQTRHASALHVIHNSLVRECSASGMSLLFLRFCTSLPATVGYEVVWWWHVCWHVR